MKNLDFVKLANVVYEDKSRVPYDENKDNFTKIAFDVFQANGTPSESLWVLQDGDDGKQYLVAMYDDVDTDVEIKAHSYWKALSDKNKSNLTLFYKDTPIRRFASSEFGFTKQDIHIFEKVLLEKLSSDKNFVSKMIDDQPNNVKEYLLNKFPEIVE